MKYSSLKAVVGMIGIGTILSGCATFTGAESKDNLQKLKIGMSKNQVLNLLGTPDSVIPEANNMDRWVYEFRTEPKKGHNLFVEFGAEGVSKAGELNGREVAAASETSVPGNCTKWRRPEFNDEALCTK